MKRSLVAGVCFAVTSSIAMAADMPVKAPVSTRVTSEDGKYVFLYNQEFRFITWEGTRGYPTDTFPRNTNAGSGRQFYTPMALQLFGEPVRDWSFDVLMRAGYVDSQQKTAGQSGSYSGMIDTILSGKVLYHGLPYVTPFFSLAMNLPTGETHLNGTQRFARMDPDIVDVPTFGEGFNIGPTVGVIIPVPSISTKVTAAVGYTSRGSYTRDDPTVSERQVSPGDEWTGVLRFLTVLDRLSFGAGTSYASSTTTTVSNVSGSSAIKQGNRTSLNANVGYLWSPGWKTVGGAGWTHVSASDFSPPLTVPGNGNGDIWRVNVGQYYFTGPWTFGINGLYLKRDANEFVPSLFEFVPAKTKWQVEGVVNYRPSDNVRLDARIARIWATERATSDVPLFPNTAIPEVKLDAWAFTLGGMIAFSPGSVAGPQQVLR